MVKLMEVNLEKSRKSAERKIEEEENIKHSNQIVSNDI